MERTLQTLYCPICGCSHTQSLAWLDSNTHEFVKWDYNEEESDTDWCPNCHQNVQAMNLIELWSEFSNVTIDEDDEIEEDFMCFPAGTSRFDVWHWFDERCPNGLAVDLMGESAE